MATSDGQASFGRELDAADEAIAIGDWARVAELADSILAVAPAQADAVAFRSLASRQLARHTEVDETERRFLTVMFVDLVGSTTISDRLDPEDFAALLERYHGVAAQAIEAYGGSVVKLLGDGVMAQFGYPRAIEDAPRRACMAALQVVEDIAAIAAEIDDRFGVPLDCRVGIHSGTAVVQGGDVLGDVPNTSAKLEGAAPTGGVAVSDETRSLLEGLFRFEEIEGVDVVGTTAFKLLRPAHVSASMRRSGHHDTDLVGRGDELSSLDREWRAAVGGVGRVVAVVGPAGIGKSRLTEEFRRRVTEGGARWIEGGAVEFRSGRPFHLFTDAIERQLVGAGVDPYDAVAASTNLGLGVDEATLLTATGSDTSLTPAQIRRTMMASISGWVEGLVAKGPTVLALEDLHWADPSSLELAGELAAATRDQALLVLLTSRVPVAMSATMIELDPLSGSELDTLMERLCGDLSLPDDVRQLLAERAGGVPLFAHELARTIRTLDSPDVEHLLPGSLRDLLAARLDSFGRAKRAAQVASVFGRSFTIDQIAEIDDSHGSFDADVVALAAGGLIEATSDAGGGFRFAHSLMQDAAYESLLRSERRTLHARAAAAIEHLDPETARRSPDLIAHHLTAAGQTRLALGRWMEAGRLAASRSASREAISHFVRAEELVADLPQSERDEFEYTVQIAVASPLTAEHGYASPEVEAAYQRAADLAGQSGDAVRRFAATRGLASTYLLRAEIERAAELGTDALRIARETGSVGSELEAQSWLGTVEFFAGRLEAARVRLVATADMYDDVEHRRHGFEFGIDPLVLADTHRAWLLQLEGDSGSALDVALAALEHARSLGHALSVAHALNYLAGLHQMSGDPEQQLRTADEEVAMAIEYGFIHYIHYGRIFAGHAQARLGDRDAVATMTSALADRSTAGAALARPYQLFLIADGRTSVGDGQRAMGDLEEAIEVVTRTGETWWQSQIADALAAAAERYS